MQMAGQLAPALGQHCHAMHIRGAEHLTPAQLQAALQTGSRVVYFEYCLSFLLATWRGYSGLFLLEPGTRGWLRGLPYTLLTLLFGWWGLPWGVVYSLKALATNLSGGRDVTAQVRDWLSAQSAEAGEET